MSGCPYDELIVKALVLQELGKCPDLGRSELGMKVTWAIMTDCKERREAGKRLREMGVTPSWESEA